MEPRNAVISFIVPTHDRPQRLAQTLTALADLAQTRPSNLLAVEIIVVDNASSPPVTVPAALADAVSVRMVRRSRNEAAAGRNAGAAAALGKWIVMLDDDSHPIDWGFLDAIADAEPDVAAIGAEIRLPDGRREAGGLPEVFIGCGVAIRRDAFLDAGGYDPTFHYYAEEYDLAAKLLLRGWRIVHDFRFRVLHEKTAAGRDLSLITQRLVRNNGWVAQRYAPESCRIRELHEVMARYARMAMTESAGAGFAQGMSELLETIDDQPRAAMDRATFNRFTGLAAAREGLWANEELRQAASVAVVDDGKNPWAVRQALRELGKRIVSDQRDAEALVIGTLSPGPMLDAADGRASGTRRAVMPWMPRFWTHHDAMRIRAARALTTANV
jgi:GT2 family glycosyltransferase